MLFFFTHSLASTSHRNMYVWEWGSCFYLFSQSHYVQWNKRCFFVMKPWCICIKIIIKKNIKVSAGCCLCMFPRRVFVLANWKVNQHFTNINRKKCVCFCSFILLFSHFSFALFLSIYRRFCIFAYIGADAWECACTTHFDRSLYVDRKHLRIIIMHVIWVFNSAILFSAALHPLIKICHEFALDSFFSNLNLNTLPLYIIVELRRRLEKMYTLG